MSGVTLRPGRSSSRALPPLTQAAQPSSAASLIWSPQCLGRRGPLLPGRAGRRLQQQQQRQRQRCRVSAAAVGLLANAQLAPTSIELARRALTATLDAAGPPVVSTSIIQAAPNGATMWFTTVCALSIALAALSYNLFSLLSELHMLQPAPKEERRVLHGVDVTGSRFFHDERVLAAVEFAAHAHAGQVRKTGEPYVSHCLETALIVEHNLPPAAEHERYVLAIIAALLHDVVDDTAVDLGAIKARFGAAVASMVGQVSKLSAMNQLLRRGKRKGWAEYGPHHFKALRKMIVDMVFEEPLVILIKLADRLHNMRTVFVLKPDKQRAVAEETLEVWCTMAECLGWDSLKSEMEDLCFAVLQPTEYCTLRAQLDRIWSLPSLKVVVEEADSASLPANALAPAPAATSSRSRRAAAATAARRAAAAAARADRDVRTATAAALKATATATATAAATSTVVLQPPLPALATAAPPRPGQDLDLGIRIVASLPLGQQRLETDDGVPASQGDPLPLSMLSRLPGGAAGAQSMAWDTMTQWSMLTSLDLEDVGTPGVAGPQPAAVGRQEGNAGGEAGLGDAVCQGMPSAPTVDELTAASVALLVASDAQTLRAVFPGLETGGRQGGDIRGSSTGWDGGGAAPAGADGAHQQLSARDVARLQAHMQRLQAATAVAGVTVAGSQGGGGAAAPPPAAPARSNPLGGGSAAQPHPAAVPGQGPGVRSTDSVAPTTALSSSGPAPSAQQAWHAAATSAAKATATIGVAPAEAASASAAAVKATTATLPRPQPQITALLSAQELEEILAAASPKPDGGEPGEGELRPVLFTAEQLAAGPALHPPSSATRGTSSSSSSSGAPRAGRGVKGSSVGSGAGVRMSPQQERLRALLATVVPFDSVNFKDTRALAMSTRRGLEVLDECAELLYSEVMLRSAGGGLGLRIQGRLKSLYSVYRKMVRKGCSVAEVYDARALRVIVGDEGGSRARDAIETCYKMVSAVHSIWKPIPQEFDDYIANPKPSGYQALHTAVRGPGGIPMELQIKTASMHELAEYGAAAHWVYKEFAGSEDGAGSTGSGAKDGASGTGGSVGPMTLPLLPMHSAAGLPDPGPGPWWGATTTVREAVSQQPALPPPVRVKDRGWRGQPVLRIAKDKLRYGVVVASEDAGQRLLVAVRAGATLPEYPIRVADYAFYRGILDYVLAKGWAVPGHSDFNVRLEEFVLSSDGRFHRKDHMGYVLPAEVLTLLEGYEEDADAAAAREALAAAAATTTTAAPPPPSVAPQPPRAGGPTDQPAPPRGGGGGGSGSGSPASSAAAQPPSTTTTAAADPTAERLRRQMQEAYLRTQQLRTMIEWGRAAMGRYHQGGSDPGDEVSVLVWPGGTIEHWPRGTTVKQLVHAKGISTLVPQPEVRDVRPSATAVAGGDDGWLSILSGAGEQPRPEPRVNVNNRLVPEDTVLNDGDLVILTREKVKI